MPPTPELPDYDALARKEKLDGNVSWGVFGASDELGAINLLTPERTALAATEIRRGTYFNLSLPLDEPEPSKHVSRTPYRHTVLTPERNVQDDVLDNFYPQGSTQIDGLRHVSARELFYNGISAADAGATGTKLGIDRWAEHGIVGRGVLADVARQWDQQGVPVTIAPAGGPVIHPALLEETLRAQGVTLRTGDVLLVRTGYLRAYYAVPLEERRVLPRAWPGLTASEEMARWLWNRQVAFVGADNPAVEARPGDPGYLHRRLIPMLGIGLGELLALEALADDCAKDGRYTFFFAAVPLNLPGGVGSPANAFALK